MIDPRHCRLQVPLLLTFLLNHSYLWRRDRLPSHIFMYSFTNHILDLLDVFFATFENLVEKILVVLSPFADYDITF
jgi:hypothetical protein